MTARVPSRGPAALLPAALLSAALLSLSPLLAPGAAWAAPAYTIEDVRACSADAVRLCSDKLADIAAAENCMRANFERLRPACKARFEHRQ